MNCMSTTTITSTADRLSDLRRSLVDVREEIHTLRKLKEGKCKRNVSFYDCRDYEDEDIDHLGTYMRDLLIHQANLQARIKQLTFDGSRHGSGTDQATDQALIKQRIKPASARVAASHHQDVPGASSATTTPRPGPGASSMAADVPQTVAARAHTPARDTDVRFLLVDPGRSRAAFAGDRAQTEAQQARDGLSLTVDMREFLSSLQERASSTTRGATTAAAHVAYHAYSTPDGEIASPAPQSSFARAFRTAHARYPSLQQRYLLMKHMCRALNLCASTQSASAMASALLGAAAVASD